jgi:hypothetical protein
MKKLSLGIFFILLTMLTFFACSKEEVNTKENQNSEQYNSEISLQPRFIHNGIEISSSSINFEDDNVEMYYDYTSQDPSVILVFFTKEEADQWIANLTEENRVLIQKSRDFTTMAREIAIQTNAVAIYEGNNTVPNDYNTLIAELNERIYGGLQDRAIGFVFSGPNFTGSSLPILGGFAGFPTLLALGSPPNSVQSLGLTMTHNFFSKKFYFGSRLFVWGANSVANVNGGAFVNVGGAAGPFHVQLVGTLFLWGSFNPNGALTKSYKPAPGIL